MIGVIHKSGCGKVAFMMKSKPKTGDILNAEDCIATGEAAKITAGHALMCTQCGEDIAHSDLRDENLVDERN